MEKQIYDEKNGLSYTLHGDYYLPDLEINEEEHAASISGLDKACENAMAQIKNRRYDETLRENGRCDILAYGIAFHKKRCRVVCERL